MPNLPLLISVLLVSLTGFADEPARGERPNLLFLLSDDHSYPFLSTYGDTNVRTPSLDQLAAEGMKFHRFFTGAP